jgi:hypothetical protein
VINPCERTVYRLFGVSLASDLRLSHAIPPAAPPATVSFRMQPREDLPTLDEPSRSTYESPFLDPDGNVRLRAASASTRDDLRFGERLLFSLGSDEIDCHFTPSVQTEDIEIYLLGAVLAYWLERQGLPCIHASAVVTPDGAIGFLAGNGGGKSTLAAFLVRAGLPLLTDDVLAIDRREDGYYGRASYPQMRFWPREAELFSGRAEGHDRVHPDLPKLRVPIGEAGFGAFHPRAAPLRALYLPERRPASEAASIEIRPVAPRDAAIELLRNSFVSHLVEAAPWARDRLARLASIAAEVPMRRLIYPSGFERLPEVCDAILRDAGLVAGTEQGPA